MPDSDSSKASKQTIYDSDGRPYKMTRLYGCFSQSIKLIVGADKVPFDVHKRLLSEACPLFNAACKPEWLKENTVALPEDDPEAITAMVFWLYQNQLGLPKRLFDSVELDGDLNTGPGLLAKVFVLGEKYQIPALMNDVMDAFVLWSKNGGKIPGKVINYTFENSEKDSKLSIFLVRFFEITFKDEIPNSITKMKDDLPHEFLVALTESLCGWFRFFSRYDYLELTLADLEDGFCRNFHKHSDKETADFGHCDQIKEYALVSEDDE